MIKCGNCGHPGSHAEVTVAEGMPKRCTQCWRCDADRKQEAEASE